MDSNDAVKSPQVQPKSMASIFSSPSSTTTTINTQRMRNANEDGGVRGSGNSRNSSRINHQSSSSASSSNAATADEVRRSTTTTSNVSAGVKRPFDSVDNSPVVASSSHRDPTTLNQLQQLLGSDIGHFHAIRSPDSIHGITPSSHHHINRGTALAASVASEVVIYSIMPTMYNDKCIMYDVWCTQLVNWNDLYFPALLAFIL